MSVKRTTKGSKPDSTAGGRTARSGKVSGDRTVGAKALGPRQLQAEDRTVRQRTPLVRRAMLDTAANLFAQRGYAGVNLRDIADALGMSRPGLYYHFSSKEKLLEAIIEEVTVSGVRQIADMVDAEHSDPERALKEAVTKSTQWVLEHNVLFRVLDRSEAEMPPELREMNDASKKAMLAHFTKIIKRGVEVGKFRLVDPNVAALTIIGMGNWTAWWFKPNGRLAVPDISEAIAEMAVNSVLRPDAHRSRSDRISDVLRILKEDVAHLSQLLSD